MKRSSMTGSRWARGFTLIELLVVIAIILILMGISLRVLATVNRKTATARTMMILETVKSALGAYYSTYGSYPNIGGVRSLSPYRLPNSPPANDGSFRGLTCYLMSGREQQLFSSGSATPPMTGFFNSEAGRWEHCWKQAVRDDRVHYWAATNSAQEGYSWKDWTNMYVTFRDGWDRELQYEYFSSNGVDGYRLWSVGQNGVNEMGGGDDVLVTFD